MTNQLDTVEWSFDRETGIGTVVLDRPDSLNALNQQLHADIATALDGLEEFDDDSDGVAVRAVVIEGAGEKAFCAGADINEFADIVPGEFDPNPTYGLVNEYAPPVVAKIDGYCLGGGLELALACDFRIASDRSRAGFPEVDLGLLPGANGVPRAVSQMGPSRAKELIMTGEHLSAEEATEAGLFDSVHPVEEFDEAVDSFVDTIANKPPLAIRAIKDSVNTSLGVGPEEGHKYAHRAFLMLQETEDHEEGAAAFSEDRDPEWKGR